MALAVLAAGSGLLIDGLLAASAGGATALAFAANQNTNYVKISISRHLLFFGTIN